MEIIYLLFPALTLVVDYYALRKKGTAVSFFLAVIGMGLLYMGLPYITASNITTYAPQNIGTPQGNIIIPAFNQTQTNPSNITSLTLVFGEILIFPQLGFMLLMLTYMFTEGTKRRYKQ